MSPFPPPPRWPLFGVPSLQVVDRADDDAWGLSSALPIGVEVVAAAEPTSESLSASKLALVIGLCAGGEARSQDEMNVEPVLKTKMYVETVLKTKMIVETVLKMKMDVYVAHGADNRSPF